jgi:hypothetical protein
LDRKRILLVTGDHGESFGEDGLYLHSSALTQVQLQTPLMLYVPGRPSRRMHEPTCHTDILPTLMHAIDGLIDEPRFLHGRSLLDSTIELSNRVLIASNRDGFEYAAIEFDAETNQPHSPYHFVGDPFLADFHLLGYGSLQDGSLVSDKVDEQHFGRVFHRMIDQLVAGSSPDLPEDATASLRQSRDHGEVRTRVMALSKLHLLDQVQRHRQDPQ